MKTLYNNEQLITGAESTTAKFIQGEKHNGSVKGFTILPLEQMEIQEALYNFPSSKINHFEIIWIKKGNATLHINDINIDSTESNIYIIVPGNTRKYISKDIVEGYYISFTKEFIFLSNGYSTDYNWTNQYLNVTANLIDHKMQYELEVIVNKMVIEYSNYFNRRQELLKGLLHIFMIYFSRYSNETRSVILHTREEELTIEFLNLVKNNFMTKKLVSDYASTLCVTPNYLNRTIKKITGSTASYHIQKEIIIEAKKNALRSGISMKEIAYDLGFETSAHFSKFFKKICGVNFTEYKKGAFI
jgi:AraC family transcriptional regulator, transcriptional activator of pobA